MIILLFFLFYLNYLVDCCANFCFFLFFLLNINAIIHFIILFAYFYLCFHLLLVCLFVVFYFVLLFVSFYFLFLFYFTLFTYFSFLFFYFYFYFLLSNYNFLMAVVIELSFYCVICRSMFFFYTVFFSRPFMNHRTVGDGGKHFFNSSQPLPLTSDIQKLAGWLLQTAHFCTKLVTGLKERTLGCQMQVVNHKAMPPYYSYNCSG